MLSIEEGYESTAAVQAQSGQLGKSSESSIGRGTRLCRFWAIFLVIVLQGRRQPKIDWLEISASLSVFNIDGSELIVLITCRILALALCRTEALRAHRCRTCLGVDLGALFSLD